MKFLYFAKTWQYSFETLLKSKSTSSEAGMATAEYAVTTVAACGFAGALYKLLSSESIAQLIGDLIRRTLSHFLM